MGTHIPVKASALDMHRVTPVLIYNMCVMAPIEKYGMLTITDPTKDYATKAVVYTIMRTTLLRSY